MDEYNTPKRTVTIDIDWFDELRSVANGDRFKTLEAAYHQVRKERDDALEQLKHFKDLELSLATKQNYEDIIRAKDRQIEAVKEERNRLNAKVNELNGKLDGESGTLSGAQKNAELFKRERDEARVHLKECERQFQAKCDELGQAVSRCNELEAANKDLKSRVVSPELKAHYEKLENAYITACHRQRIAADCIKDIEKLVHDHFHNIGGPDTIKVVGFTAKAIETYHKKFDETIGIEKLKPAKEESDDCRPAVPNVDPSSKTKWCASCISKSCPFNQVGMDRLMVCSHYVPDPQDGDSSVD